jgi:hypothetical protein
MTKKGHCEVLANEIFKVSNVAFENNTWFSR